MTDDPEDDNDDSPSLPPTSRRTVAMFVRSLLLEQQPQLHAPDGRPLYAYRVSAERYEQLKSRVRFEFEELLSSRCDPATAAGFVLFAAETWRRSATIERWNDWDVVLEPLSRADLPRPRLYPAVEVGLNYWDRQVRTVGDKRRPLATLVCEGGLPLHLVRERGTPLRAYFRDIVAHVRDFGLNPETLAQTAESLADRLAQGLRNEGVYELSAELAAAIWRFHDLLQNAEGDPIRRLDRVLPNWREQCPIRLDEDLARGLLTELLDDVEQVIAHRGDEPQVRRSIRLQSDGWRLRACIDLPQTMPQSAFYDSIGRDRSEPAGFTLSAVAASGQLPAFASALSDGEKVTFQVGNARRAEIHGEDAADLVCLGVDARESGSHGMRATQVAGGAALSPDAPWTFRPDEDGYTAHLVGAGSLRTRHPEVWVAVAKGSTTTASDGATWEPKAMLEESGRTLYACRGQVRVSDAEGDSWTITTGAESDTRIECSLQGRTPRFTTSDHDLYLGMPEVRVRENGLRRSSLPDVEVAWRPTGAGKSDWSLDQKRALGHVELRVRIGGETHLRKRVQLLPSDFRCNLVSSDTSLGRLELSGTAGAEVLPFAVDDITATVGVGEQGSVVIELQKPAELATPGSLRARLRWPQRAPVDLLLPFPFRSMYFERRNGARCSAEFVSVDDLSSMRAVAITPNPNERFEVLGRVRSGAGAESPSLSAINRIIAIHLELKQRDNGVHHADLYPLVERIRSALSAYPDPDLEVELMLKPRSSAKKSVRLLVRNYPSRIHCDREGGTVQLGKGTENLEEKKSSITLECFPLWKPSAALQSLARASGDKLRWTFDTSSKEPGPWFLYAAVDGMACSRPAVWTVPRPADEGAPPEEKPADPVDSFRAAIDAPPELRAARQKDLYARLAAQPNHPAWSEVEALLQRAEALPPSTTEVVTGLRQAPTTLAMLFLRQTLKGRFEKIVALRDEMPFEWQLLPLRSWRAAWRAETEGTAQRWAEAGMDQQEIDSIPLERGKRLLRQIPEHERVLHFVMRWAVSGPTGLDCPAEIMAMRNREQAIKMVASLSAKPWNALRIRRFDQEWPHSHTVKVASFGPAISALDRRLEFIPGGDDAAKAAVARAPWVAAALTLDDAAVDPILCLELRRIRDFDRTWFDEMQLLYVAAALAQIQ